MAFLQHPFAFGGRLHLAEAEWHALTSGPHDRLQDKLMALAIEESMKAMGHASPNPAVGCIVYKDGRILARGHTDVPGKAHAERMAFENLGGAWPEASTVVVSLEPCAHHGRTPPCLELFENASPLTIWIGCPDPNPAVAGRSIEQLKAWGHRVEVGVLAKEVGVTLLPFFKQQLRGELFIGLKWAQSLDGQLADDHSKSKWLTGDAIRQYTHWLRHRYDAIAVGLGTALADKPSLTARELLLATSPHNPKRFVLDASGRLTQMTPFERKQLEESRSDGWDGWTFVSPAPRSEVLPLAQGTWWCLRPDGGESFFGALQRALTQGGPEASSAPVSSLLVEGGADTLARFWEEKKFDYVHDWVAGILLGPGRHGLRPGRGPRARMTLDEAMRMTLIQAAALGNDVLTEWAPPSTMSLLEDVFSLVESASVPSMPRD